ncbi:MAG: HAD-IIB family hydrolase [Planctomycetota bacterium]
MKSRPLRALASDLDGTLFPIDDSPSHHAAMGELIQLITAHKLRCVFVTGRSADQTFQGIQQYSPPEPETIICDVGTTILHRHADGFEPDADYHDELHLRLGDWDHARLLSTALQREPRLWAQPEHQQSDLKTSFYYPAQHRADVQATIHDWIETQRVPVSMTISVDPFEGLGMLDLLPQGVEKGFALRWWLRHSGLNDGEVVYAGDTGNDISAINSGVHAILVGNADAQLRQAAAQHREQTDPTAGEAPVLYQAQETATAGVLEGLRMLLGQR